MINRKNLVYLIIYIYSNTALLGNNLNIFYASIPKCGSHLLQKYLSLLTDKEFVVSDNRLFLKESQLNNLSSNNILSSHAFCNNENLNLINKKKLRGIFIYRDPRDHIISFIYHLYKMCKINLLERTELKKFNQLNLEKLLFKLINDYEAFFKMWNINYDETTLKIGNTPKYKTNITIIYKKYDGWKKQKNMYVTTFEKLVGPQGAGKLNVQLNELRNIAKHLNINIHDKKLMDIANNLHGDTCTFREGKIGSWKKYFTPEHKAAFKKVAGQLLIDLGYEKDFNW